MITTSKISAAAGINSLEGFYYPKEPLTRLSGSKADLRRITIYGDSTVEGATHSGATDDVFVDHFRDRMKKLYGKTNVHDGFQGTWRRNSHGRASDPARWLFTSTWVNAASNCQIGPHPGYVIAANGASYEVARWTCPEGGRVTEFDIWYVNNTNIGPGFSYSVNGGFSYVDVPTTPSSGPTIEKVTISGVDLDGTVGNRYIYIKASNAAGTVASRIPGLIGIDVRQGWAGVVVDNLGQSGASWADHNGLEGSVGGSRVGDWGLWFDMAKPDLVITQFTNDINTATGGTPTWDFDTAGVTAAVAAFRARVGNRKVSGVTTTLGSLSITGASGSFVSGDVGKLITGASIPDGTTVNSVVSDTSIILSAAATGSGKGAVNIGNADIVHFGMPEQWRIGSGGPLAYQQALRQILKDDALNNNSGFLDFTNRWGTATNAISLGYYDDTFFAIHANGVGARNIGVVLGNYVNGLIGLDGGDHVTSGSYDSLEVTGNTDFGGNVAISGTLGVTGASTLANTSTHALSTSGDITVNTNKFTVAALTGNTATAGGLTVSGATSLASLSVSGTTVLPGYLYGGTASGDNLRLYSTTHSTKGIINLYDRTTIGGNLAAAQLPSPTAREIMRITSATSAGDAVAEVVYQARATTTTASATSMLNIPFVAGSIMTVEATVVCHRSDTSEDGGAWKLFAAIKDVSGLPTLVSATTTIASSVSNAATATIDCNSSNIRVKVTGVAATNISWHTTARVHTVDT